MKVEDPTGGVLFEEAEYFPKWLLGLIVSPVLVTIIVTVVTSAHSRDSDKIFPALLLIVILQLALFFIFLKVRLEKVVTRNGLYHRWHPLQKKYKVISGKDIEKFEMRTSPSLKYGYGSFPGYGHFYNMSNGKGLQFYLSNGKKIFFSTNDLLSFENAVKECNEYGKKLHT